MFLGKRINPLVRVAIAVALIAVGITQHEWGLDVAGGLVLAVAGWQLYTRRHRETGSSR